MAETVLDANRTEKTDLFRHLTRSWRLFFGGVRSTMKVMTEEPYEKVGS